MDPIFKIEIELRKPLILEGEDKKMGPDNLVS